MILFKLRSKLRLIRRILKAKGVVALCFDDGEKVHLEEYNPDNLHTVKYTAKAIRRKSHYWFYYQVSKDN